MMFSTPPSMSHSTTRSAIRRVRMACFWPLLVVLLCCEPSGRLQAQVSALDPEVTSAEASLARGDRAAAAQTAGRVVSAFQALAKPTSADHVAAGRAYVILGLGDATSVRRALSEFDAARAADPSNLDAELRAGELFLDKYNAPDARASFEAVLARAPNNARALLGLALVADFEGKGDVLTAARRSVAADARLTDALVLVARQYLESEQYDSARTIASRAIASDSASVAAWSLLGATAWVTGDSATYQAARTAATRLQPRPATFYTELAEASVRQRRYAEAVQFASRAVSLDSQSVRALGVLGTNELRIGRIADGTAALDRAFALDPFNLWHKNTLDLLDKMRAFRTIDRGRFQLVAPAEEADLLALYGMPLLESAFDALTARYGYSPPTPVRLEFYRYHADFSVRTVGLAGLGALGVSFGSLLAMDTPSARERGEFNWGSTAWHELTHAFTLGASDHRVPRWLSEGMSVLEERRAGHGWGADATLSYVAALKADRLRPMSDLNNGFLRPRFPEETNFSYYQASLFCEMVEQQKGASALRAMLIGYRDGLDTPGVFKRVLGMTPAQVDAAFDAYSRAKFAKPLAAVSARDSAGGPAAQGAFVTAMQKGVTLLARSERDSARTAFVQAREMFPGYSGTDGPSWYLAQLEKAAGNDSAALRYVADVTMHNETAWDANLLQADLSEKRGDAAGAIAALERLMWIYPYDPALHARMATLASARGDFAVAVREREAAVYSSPADVLSARYELASARAAAGDVAGARRDLLQVLEQAPSFEKAQTLLLQLRGKSQ